MKVDHRLLLLTIISSIASLRAPDDDLCEGGIDGVGAEAL